MNLIKLKLKTLTTNSYFKNFKTPYVIQTFLSYLTNILLNKFRTNNSDKTSISSVGNSACTESFTSARWSKQQHTLRGLNAKVYKSLWLNVYMKHEITLYVKIYDQIMLSLNNQTVKTYM